MYCQKCGQPVDGSTAFCGVCGAKQEKMPTTVPVTKTPAKKMKKTLPMLLSIILVVAVGVSAVATRGFGLLKNTARNPIAITLDGAISLLKLNSFSFSGDGSFYDSFDFSGAIELSDRINDARGYLDSEFDGAVRTFALEKGELFGENTNLDIFSAVYELQEEIDDYNLLDIDAEKTINDLLAMNESFSLDNIIAMYAEDAYTALKSYVSKDVNLYDLPEYRSEWADTICKLLNGFIYEELSKEAVMESVFIKNEREKKGGNTTVTYTVDIANLIRALQEYLLGQLDNNLALKDLQSIFVKVATRYDSDYANLKRLIREASAEILEELNSESVKSMNVTVCVDKKGVLQEFGVELSNHYNKDEKASLHVAIGNHNKANLAILPERIAALRLELQKNGMLP